MYSGSQPPFHRSAITQKYAYKTQRSCLFKKHLYRRHRSVSVEKGDSGRSGVRGEIVKKKSRLWGEPQAGGLEPRTGLEPVTYALRMRRSTS